MLNRRIALLVPYQLAPANSGNRGTGSDWPGLVFKSCAIGSNQVTNEFFPPQAGTRFRQVRKNGCTGCDWNAFLPQTAAAAGATKRAPPYQLPLARAMGRGDRCSLRAAAPLPPGAPLPLAQSNIHADGLALDPWRAGGAKLRADRAHGAGVADHRDRRRGWSLRPSSRNRLAGVAGPLGGCRRRERSKGRVHHHPADGEESVSLARPKLCAQSSGIAPRIMDRCRLAEMACA